MTIEPEIIIQNCFDSLFICVYTYSTMCVSRTIMDLQALFWFLLKKRTQNSGLTAQAILFLLTALVSHFTVERSLQQIPRTSAWFDLAYSTYSDDQWYANFRVSKNTFHFLVDELRADLERQDTEMRKAVTVHRKVALFLYYLVSTDSYRSLGNLFGLSREFVCICFRQVLEAILRKLKPNYISFPKGDELLQVNAHYKERWGFPMCAGAIHGTHIAIATPPHNHVAYVNRKSYHSIVMQAVVDGHYMFRDIVVGWPDIVVGCSPTHKITILDVVVSCFQRMYKRQFLEDRSILSSWVTQHTQC